jgi:hypothetical protein
MKLSCICYEDVTFIFTTGRWFSPGPSVSSSNKTDRHDITELLLKVELNTIKQTNKQTNKQTCFMVNSYRFVRNLIFNQ